MASRALKSEKNSGLAEARPHYRGHRERLRARFNDAGPDAVSDYEMLELVLFRAIPQRDVKPLAKDMIAKFGSFAEVLAAPRRRLEEIKGLGDAAITELKIVQAAAGRLARGQVKGRTVLSSWSAVLEYIRTLMAFEDRGTVPHPVSRQAQPADRRRAAADRNGRSHAGLSARGGQARARTVRHRDHPGAQPSVRRSHTQPRGHPDDPADSGDRQAARHFGSRPHHRREGRPRQPEGAAADLTRPASTSRRGQAPR